MSGRCAFEGCERSVRTRGLCNGHYEQKRLGRTPGLLKSHSAHDKTVVERVALRSQRDPSGCVVWTGSVDATVGYPRMTYRGRVSNVHTHLYAEVVGPVPEGHVIDHKCRNRRCVNVDHLQAVTPKQNGENLGLSRANSSGFRGVSRHKATGKWTAEVSHRGKKYSGGYFDTAGEAGSVARQMRMDLFTNNLADHHEDGDS